MQLTSTPTPHSLFPAAEKSALGLGVGAGNSDGRREMVWVRPDLPGPVAVPKETMVRASQLLRQAGPVNRVGCSPSPLLPGV